MSGAGIGQVGQAAINDPDAVNKDLVIIAGANDVKKNNFPDKNDYAQSVRKGLQKLIDIAEERPKQKILVPLMIPTDAHNNLVDDEEIAIRRSYLHRKATSMITECRKRENPVMNIAVMTIPYEVNDTGHPTIKGTAQILTKINSYKELPTPLICYKNGDNLILFP